MNAREERQGRRQYVACTYGWCDRTETRKQANDEMEGNQDDMGLRRVCAHRALADGD